MAVGEQGAGEERVRPLAGFGERRAGLQEAGIGIGIGEGVDVAAQIGEAAGVAGAIDDEIGLVERSPPPERNGDELQSIAVGDEREAADPRGVELAGDEQGRDLLVGAPRHQRHRRSGGALEVGLQAAQQLEVGGEKDRGQPETDRRGRGRRGVRTRDGAEHQRGGRG